MRDETRFKDRNSVYTNLALLTNIYLVFVKLFISISLSVHANNLVTFPCCFLLFIDTNAITCCQTDVNHLLRSVRAIILFM